MFMNQLYHVALVHSGVQTGFDINVQIYTGRKSKILQTEHGDTPLFIHSSSSVISPVLRVQTSA